jgi:hypothetical protein
MKLILKDGVVFAEDALGLNDKILIIDTQYVSEDHVRKYKISYSGGESFLVDEGTAPIPDYVLTKDRVTITVEAVPLVKGLDTLTFKSDSLPITLCTVFGKPTGELYPASVKDLYRKLHQLKSEMIEKDKRSSKRIKELELAVVEMDEKNDIL